MGGGLENKQSGLYLTIDVENRVSGFLTTLQTVFPTLNL